MVYDFALPELALVRALRATADFDGLLEIHGEDKTALWRATSPASSRVARPRRVITPSRVRRTWRPAGRRMRSSWRARPAPLSISCTCRVGWRWTRSAARAPQASRCLPKRARTSWRWTSRATWRPTTSVPNTSSLRRCARRDDRAALWDALRDGAAGSRRHGSCPGSRGGREAADRASRSTEISNGAPGIETLLAIVYSEGVQRGRVTVERMVDLLSTTPARLFGLQSKAQSRSASDADIVLFDPQERRTITQSELHHTSDYTPYEGLAAAGSSGPCCFAVSSSSATATSSAVADLASSRNVP